MLHPTQWPTPNRFMFWTLSPFLLALIIVLPLGCTLDGCLGWFALVLCETLAITGLLGLWDYQKFHICWKLFGASLFLMGLMYLIDELRNGNWFRNASMVSSLLFMYYFGWPGLMYLIFGRTTFNRLDPEDWATRYRQ